MVRRAVSQRERQPSPVGLDPPLHDALTDLCTYVLLLDAEWERLGQRIEEVSRVSGNSQEGSELAEFRVRMAEELEALRTAVTALREHADAQSRGARPPAGRR